jgi:soluble lytic murein transglycosylase-like protein/outer membrane protein assembly factor BamD (BamD/ComL family)
MKIFRRLLFILLILLGLCPLSAFADHLDVFGTGKTFPADFLFKEEIPSLKNLSSSDMELVLQKFIDARDQVESPIQDNLIHLGISYIHLLQKNYKKSFEILNEEIKGEFILEDFRTYFLTVALRALAEESVQEETFDQAIEYLRNAIKNQMILFKDFPSSPFHEDVPRILAQIETRLGDVYFKKEDYPAAWNSYNNALAREYPNYEEAHFRIYTALARTYEAGADLNEAADTHIYLLNNFSSGQTTKAALAFLENNPKALEESSGNAKRLKQLLKGKEEEGDLPMKHVARKSPKWPHTNNETFDNLYHALSSDDFPKIVEYGEKVLKEFPGDENARGIFSHFNHAILKKVQSVQWSDGMDRLVDLYPVHQMNKLASRLWESGFPDAAQLIYQKVLDNHPTETLACHKALFFMGRIEEDNHRYPEAINFYEKLLSKYNWGYFTPSAQFKIPWLHRLQGKLEEAREGFNKLLKYAKPEKYRNPENGFQEPDDFRPAALYWLADTERQLENYDSKVVFLKQLVEKFPMDFYAMIARIEMSMQPLNFLEPRSIQKSSPRKWGLGDINRKRINRAEKLISIGFLEMGMKELSWIPQEKGNEEFLYYLAQLYKKAGGYQRAIGLSWGISRKSHHNSISPSLAEILFPKPYIKKAIQESSQYNLNPYLILALMRQESAFNKKVVSSAHAIGLMQLLPTTATRVARSMGTKPPDQDDLKKPEVNIQLGVKYLSGLLNDFEDNIIFALASYNAGPSKVKQWMDIRSNLRSLEFMESIPYKETRNYVKKVLRNYVIYKTLYGQGGIHDFQSILTVRNN